MTTLFRLIVRVLGAMVFLALLGLAIKNSGAVEVRFFFDRSWLAPVSVVILASFAAGVMLGLVVAYGRRRGHSGRDAP